MRPPLLLPAVMFVALCARPASAQVDVTGEPTYGTHVVSSGFRPDPTAYVVVAGGTVDARSVGETCRGRIASAPTVRIDYTAGTYPLRFYVDSESDTTLAIRAPDGTWHCDDDTVGLNPVIDFAAPQSGRYDVFVGTYVADQSATATLSMTELPEAHGPGLADDAVMPPTPAGLGAWGSPSAGSFTVSSGFSPDPTQYAVVAGGVVRATAADPTCRGWIDANPDVRVSFTAGTFPLRFYVDSPSDTTLVVYAPDGTWHCNDDTVGLNPVVDFATPLSGRYDIFVGTYSAADMPAVMLSMTELPGSYGPSAGTPLRATPPVIDLNGVPVHGVFTVSSGFTPDPQSVTVTAGGPIAVSATVPECDGGHVTATPTVRIDYSAGAYPLSFYVSTPGTDTAIAVNAPDGTWHCNNDAVGLQPVVEFGAPQSGRYDVFVGTHLPGQMPTVQLYWTELPASHGPTL